MLRGITVTGGAIDEPFAPNLFKFDGIFRNLFEGANVGDAVLRNTPVLKWRLVNIGDPLYRPFSGSSFPRQPTALPSQWTVTNIGGVTGSAVNYNGNFEMQARGGDLYAESDAFNFAYQPLNGNGQIIARVNRTENTGDDSFAGVMFRETLSAGSRHIAVTTSNYGQLRTFVRSVTDDFVGGAGEIDNFDRYFDNPYPLWLKLERRGGTFDVSKSFDGVNWTLISSRNVEMSTNAYVGLVTSSGNFSNTNTAFYDKARVLSPATKGRVFANRPRGRSGATGVVPATLQAEDFDNGGQTEVYYDGTAGNSGGAYRTTDVDIKADGSAANSHAVFEARAGEWLEYTVDVETSGAYGIAAKVASAQGGGKFHIEIDGADVTGSLSVPATGSSSNYQLVGKNNINLTAGVHILRLAFDANGGDGKAGDFDTVEVAAGNLTVAPQHAVLNTNNFYRLMVKHSGKFMDVSGSSWNDGAGIVQTSDGTQKSQRFQFKLTADGYYTIAAKHSGKCINIEGGSSTDGARAVQAICNSSPSQQFSIIPVSEGFYSLRARHSGKALDIQAFASNDGAQVLQYYPHNGDNQMWKFESLSVCQDLDGDGFCVGQDCNDANRDVHPNATMFCEMGEDGNCNGLDDYEECGGSGIFIDPIIIDVLGNGFHLTDGAGGVFFDLNGDGVREKLSWTALNSDDAWLVLDRNGNGMIDDGRELFSELAPQEHTTDRNGFLALAEHDKYTNGGNGDGVIDRRDAVFARLRLWQDTNHNGISESEELHTLPTLDVVSINLDYKESKRTDEHGNRFRYRAKVRDAKDAKVGRWAWDVFLVPAPQ